MGLVDESGADALTLRSLAERLGSSTATLYRHFENRAALIDSVVDALFGEVELDSDLVLATTWDTALSAMATSLFGALERHQNVAPLMLERIRTATNVRRIQERVLALLLDAGFTPRNAFQIYATVGRFVLGFGVQTRIDGRVESLESNGPALSTETHPATAAVASIDPISLADEFQFGLRMIIVGIQATGASTGFTSLRESR